MKFFKRKPRVVPHQVERLMDLHTGNTSRRGAAEITGINRNTVNRYFKMFDLRIQEDEQATSGSLSGETEMDETYCGGDRRRWGADLRHGKNLRKVSPSPGKERSDEAGGGGKGIEFTAFPPEREKQKRGRGSLGKICVLGAIERSTGRLIFKVTNSLKKIALTGFCRAHIAQGATIFTDAFKGYNDLGKAGFNHISINKAAGEWKKSAYTNEHTQNIENAFGRLKLWLAPVCGGWRHDVDRWLSVGAWRLRIKNRGVMLDKLRDWFSGLLGKKRALPSHSQARAHPGFSLPEKGFHACFPARADGTKKPALVARVLAVKPFFSLGARVASQRCPILPSCTA